MNHAHRLQMTSNKPPTKRVRSHSSLAQAVWEDFYAPFAAGEDFAQMAPALRRDFQSAEPFSHVVIDDFFDAEILEQVIAEVPFPADAPGFVRHKLDRQINKYAFREVERLGPFTRQLIATVNTKPFLDFLGAITGIEALISDCYLGGGFQQTTRGGKLDIHADFSVHPATKLDRRLNMLIFLNKDWKDEYGGHLELWSPDMTRCVKRIAPEFNRVVIFATTDQSLHGHPEPLDCPADISRKSLCLFYYSNGRPDDERSPLRSGPHVTMWQDRPGYDASRSWGSIAKTTVSRLWARISAPHRQQK